MTSKADFFKSKGIIEKLPEKNSQEDSKLMESVQKEDPKSVYGKHHQHSKQVHHKHLRNNCLFGEKDGKAAGNQDINPETSIPKCSK